MKYKITPDQVKLMMDDILKRKNIKVDIMYWTHSLHTNNIKATVYLYKDGQVFGNRHGYEFTFNYDKRFDSLVYKHHFPHIEKLDFLKMIPEEVILKYFTDKTEEYLRGYLDRGNVPAFKRLVSEELDTTKSNYEKQVAVLKRLLKSKNYEGVCRYNFTHDKDNDRVAGVIATFSSDWYRKSDEQKYLNIQLMKMQTTKQDIRQIAKRFLGIENLYVGAYLEDCNSSLNEQKKPKSFLQKSPKYGEKKKHRPDIQGEIEELQRVTQYLNRDEGLDITINDLVNAFQKSKEITLDNETWSQLENTESNEIEKGDFDAVIDIAKKYNKSNPKKLAEKLKSGDYNRPLIVKFGDRYHVVAGNTRLSTSAALGLNPKVFIATIGPSDNLQESKDSSNPKDLAFQKTLKRVIPDGSIYKSDYPLPYSDEGHVHVIMKYSVLPSSKIMKMEREDGTFYDAIQVHLQIDELLWKSDFDKEWERVEKNQSLPSSFWSMFEDGISDLVYKKMGLGYVEVYYKYPPIH